VGKWSAAATADPSLAECRKILHFLGQSGKRWPKSVEKFYIFPIESTNLQKNVEKPYNGGFGFRYVVDFQRLFELARFLRNHI
jgi:hypothetical protein